jgi:hypothetical protein
MAVVSMLMIPSLVIVPYFSPLSLMRSFLWLGGKGRTSQYYRLVA